MFDLLCNDDVSLLDEEELAYETLARLLEEVRNEKPDE